MTMDQLREEVLKLSVAERAELAEWIASNLEVEQEVERAWVEEVRLRDEQVDSGAVSTLPVQEALAVVRERFGW